MNFKKLKNKFSFILYPIVIFRVMSLVKQIYKLEEEEYISFMLFWKMGDIILSTRIIHEIKKKNPSVKICYVTSKSFRFALEDNSEVNKILTVKMYQEGRFSGILNEALWFLSKKIIKKSKKFKKTYFLQIYPEYTENIGQYKGHLMDFYAEKAGIRLDSKNPYFFTKGEHKEYFKKLCKEKGLEKKLYVAVGHIASAEEKTWPIEKFKKLGKRILKKNPSLKIVFIGAAKDKYIEDKGFISIKGENLGNVSEIIKNSKLFIGLDSGLIHLASAFKQPIFGIYSEHTPLTLSYPISNNLTLINSKYLGKLKVDEVFDRIKDDL